MLERRLRRGLSGGVRIGTRKAMAAGGPIVRGLQPQRLVIPMAQHAGPAAIPTVTVGQRVRKGELIGRPAGPRSAGVHAARSGRIRAIEPGPAPTARGLTASLCIHLQADGRDEPATPLEWPADRDDRIDAIRDAGIVGLGGATFPTAAKLRGEATGPGGEAVEPGGEAVEPGGEAATLRGEAAGWRGGTDCELLILNGAECDPCIGCDDMLMREHPLEIARGALAMLELVGARAAVLAVEEDKPEALDAMRAAADRLDDPRLEFARVPAVYPAGGERQLVEMLTGREVPSGDYPPAAGCICLNVATARALDRLIRRGEPLISRIVTVTGRGVARPGNVEVPIGTPIRDLVEFCGGYRGEVARLVLGGNMMGYALPGDDLPITKAGNCLLAAHAEEVRESPREWPCIRCGDCAEACPPRLLPQEILRAAAAPDFDRLAALGLDDCIECGCCDVVCPSRIRLTERFRRAKRATAAAAARAALADRAARRHQRKLRRLAAQAEAGARRQEDLIAALDHGDALSRIEAAVARTEQRRQEHEANPLREREATRLREHEAAHRGEHKDIRHGEREATRHREDKATHRCEHDAVLRRQEHEATRLREDEDTR